MSQIEIQSLDELQVQTVRWLWPAWLPAGKHVLLDGEPGLGKSLLTLDIGARVSRGGPMPDGSVCLARRVVILSAEDDSSDTILPRLAAAGADLKAVKILGHVLGGQKSGRPRPVQLPDDEELLLETVGPLEPGLIIIDPIVAFISAAYSVNSEHAMREVFQSVARLAAATGACVLALRHLNKAVSSPALYRGGGSMGIIGAARVGLLVLAPNAAAPERVLSVLKSNLAARPPSWVFRLAASPGGMPVIDWQGPVAPENDPVSQLGRLGRESAAEAAAVFLLERLASGPVPARELIAAASQAGISETALRQAKDLIDAQHQVVARDGKRIWVWRLSSASVAKAQPAPASDRPRTWADWGVGAEAGARRGVSM
jgi:AAA domain